MRELQETWAIILAGGDGTRLQALTRRIAGDDRPKQYCALANGETLLERTRRRADLAVRSDRQLVVVTRAHAEHFRYLERELLPGRLVVQPANRGTLAGIVYPMLRLGALAGDPVVAVLPSDHEVREDRLFMDHVRRAAALAAAWPDRVVMLGIEAEAAETEYGWILPGVAALPVDGPPVFTIERFIEKPGPAAARALLERGGLWNSFVMVGRVGAFLDLVRDAGPGPARVLRALRRGVGTNREAPVVDLTYSRLPVTGFSETVLARRPERLLVTPVKGVGWTDLGNPRRVLESLQRRGWRPPWLPAVASGT